MTQCGAYYTNLKYGLTVFLYTEAHAPFDGVNKTENRRAGDVVLRSLSLNETAIFNLTDPESIKKITDHIENWKKQIKERTYGSSKRI